MIRLRKTDGSAQEISEPGVFVELVNDLDGTVMLSFLQVKPGALLQISPGSSDALRYEQMFARQGVQFSQSMTVRESR